MDKQDNPLSNVALASQIPGDVSYYSERYGLPIANINDHDHEFLLVKTTGGWQLRDTSGKLKPWIIDFFTPELQQRVKTASTKTEPLARAIGIKANKKIKVLDATAGLGRDSYLLATMGCDVLMLERSPVMVILLTDALNQTRHLSLDLRQVDAKNFLQTDEANEFDVIYLDPMFPEKTKKALVKKEMQILQKIIGGDSDSNELFQLALKKAKQRVVVKRPKSAAPLGNKKPSYEILSKNYRFDVYTPRDSKCEI